MDKYEHLLSPITIGSMTVKNRVFMAPMSTHLADTGGLVTLELLKYYETRAEGGVGYITVPSVLIEKNSRYGTYRNLCLYEDTHIDNLHRLTAAVHLYGTKIGAQLLHPAVACPPDYNNGRQPVAASPVGMSAYNEIPRPLTIDEIHWYVQAFAQASKRAQLAGFDAVEIHCCHRHGLLGSFLSPLHNKRIDAYGGNADGRARMAVETIQAVRNALGPDFPIIVRMSATDEEPGGQSLNEGLHVARLFERAGASMIHLSDGALECPWNTTAPAGREQGFNGRYAARYRANLKIPVGVVGRINEPWVGEQLLEQGCCDTVYVGRALICDPEFVNKARSGNEAQIRPCIGCLRCLAAANADSEFYCTMNPAAGHELRFAQPWPKTEQKKVLVVGGGPAGLASAAYAAQRGHRVILIEKDSRLGGQMYLAAFPPCKQEIAKATRFLIEQAEFAGVKILLETEVTEKMVADGHYDLIIMATGNKNILPRFLQGADHLVTARDALEGKVHVGMNTVVVGGGPVGCEVADFLIAAHQDLGARSRRVTIIEQDTMLARTEKTSARALLIQRLLTKGCRILTGACVKQVAGRTMTYEVDGQDACLKDIDTVVSAAGFTYENPLLAELAKTSVPVCIITDTVDIHCAISQAYEAVRKYL